MEWHFFMKWHDCTTNKSKTESTKGKEIQTHKDQKRHPFISWMQTIRGGEGQSKDTSMAEPKNDVEINNEPIDKLNSTDIKSNLKKYRPFFQSTGLFWKIRVLLRTPQRDVTTQIFVNTIHCAQNMNGCHQGGAPFFTLQKMGCHFNKHQRDIDVW